MLVNRQHHRKASFINAYNLWLLYNGLHFLRAVKQNMRVISVSPRGRQVPKWIQIS